jgi:hypothetical protein
VFANLGPEQSSSRDTRSPTVLALWPKAGAPPTRHERGGRRGEPDRPIYHPRGCDVREHVPTWPSISWADGLAWGTAGETGSIIQRMSCGSKSENIDVQDNRMVGICANLCTGCGPENQPESCWSHVGQALGQLSRSNVQRSLLDGYRPGSMRRGPWSPAGVTHVA